MILSIFGAGFHQVILDEMELGRRVAICLDAENNTPETWAYINYERIAIE